MRDLSSILASILQAFGPSTPSPQPALGPYLTFLTKIFLGLANKVSTPGSFHPPHPSLAVIPKKNFTYEIFSDVIFMKNRVVT